MIKILSRDQIRKLDEYTIKNEPVRSIDLMERACHAFVQWFVQRFVSSNKVLVVCGHGNNGGDGLGIARMLSEWGYPVQVLLVSGSNSSPDLKMNRERLPASVLVHEWQSAPPDLDQFDILIDALFGSGLSKPVTGFHAELIRKINSLKSTIVAVDVPSGLLIDGHIDDDIIKADFTVTFQLPKLSFFFPQYEKFTGQWFVVDIGLDKKQVARMETDFFQLTVQDISKLLQPRGKFGHKGNYGHALTVGGSFGSMGAAVLMTRAALRAGAGLVTAHSPRCGYGILQAAVPEAMVSVDADEEVVSTIPALERFSTIAIGPGIGQSKKTLDALKHLLTNYQRPMVIDADALNLLAANESMWSSIPKGSILTPHPKEFERFVESWGNDFERLDKLRAFARRLSCIVVLKGAFSSIALPTGEVYFNPTGNPGMATGGSGDVLTGILAGLLAQGYEPAHAAVLGVFLHGLSGDKAAIELGQDSLIASDLIDYLPKAFLQASFTR